MLGDLKGDKGQGNDMISKLQPMFQLMFPWEPKCGIQGDRPGRGADQEVKAHAREITLQNGCVICAVICKGIPAILNFGPNVFVDLWIFFLSLADISDLHTAIPLMVVIF